MASVKGDNIRVIQVSQAGKDWQDIVSHVTRISLSVVSGRRSCPLFSYCGETQMKPEAPTIVEATSDLVMPGEVLYIATDERDKSFFDPFREDHRCMERVHIYIYLVYIYRETWEKE